LHGTTSFGILSVKVCAGVLAVGDWKNKKKQKRIGKHANIGCIFRVCGEKKPLDGSHSNFVWL